MAQIPEKDRVVLEEVLWEGMMKLWIILMVLGLHWLFDFVFQTQKQAENKSKSFKYLYDHAAIYCLWGFVLPFIYDSLLSVLFFAYLFFTHSCIDFFTSRINSWLYGKGRIHEFFVMIGADQMLHYITIFWYLDWIGLMK